LLFVALFMEELLVVRNVEAGFFQSSVEKGEGCMSRQNCRPRGSCVFEEDAGLTLERHQGAGRKNFGRRKRGGWRGRRPCKTFEEKRMVWVFLRGTRWGLRRSDLQEDVKPGLEKGTRGVDRGVFGKRSSSRGYKERWGGEGRILQGVDGRGDQGKPSCMGERLEKSYHRRTQVRGEGDIFAAESFSTVPPTAGRGRRTGGPRLTKGLEGNQVQEVIGAGTALWGARGTGG